jgi:hypothetical protein
MAAGAARESRRSCTSSARRIARSGRTVQRLII